MTTIPMIQCACCGGSGRHELQADYWQTLQVLRSHTKPVTTEQLREPGITRNAINNRLITLEEHGLIERAGKQGKFILWQPCKKGVLA